MVDDIDELKGRIAHLEEKFSKMGTIEKKKEKKEKRPPSEYNMFIGKFLNENKGTDNHKTLFAKATAAWKAQKAQKAPSDKK